jgi:hypothetical protein
MTDNGLFFLIVAIAFSYKIIRCLLNYLDTRKLYAIVPAESLSQILLERERMNAEKRRRSALMWAGGILGGGVGSVLGGVCYVNNSGAMTDNAIETSFVLMWLAMVAIFAGLGIIAAYFIDRKLAK